MRKGAAILMQVAVAALVGWFAWAALAPQWERLRDAGDTVRLRWGWITASGVLVLGSYAVLIETWRRTVALWGAHLPWWGAARIWCVSNLGRYVPGKVWQLGAMGVLAQRAGVSPAAAVGSSLLLAVVNVVAGVAVIAAAGGAGAFLSAGAAGMVVGAGLALVVFPNALPWLVTAAAKAAGRSVALPRVPWAAGLVAFSGCAAAWVLYGLAFRSLAQGTIVAPAGEPAVYVAVFTASYLAGFLALFAPGGVGVREAAMLGALTRLGLTSAAGAAALTIASRAWLTVLEVLPGLVLLLGGAPRRDASTPPHARPSDGSGRPG